MPHFNSFFPLALRLLQQSTQTSKRNLFDIEAELATQPKQVAQASSCELAGPNRYTVPQPLHRALY